MHLEYDTARWVQKNIATHSENLQHFFAGDESIPIDVVHLEAELEFVLHTPSQHDAEAAHKLTEVQLPVGILVKHAEHVLCKL